jgi:hypothetical protein
MKYSMILFLFLFGCKSASDKKISELEAEILRLKEENLRLSNQISIMQQPLPSPGIINGANDGNSFAYALMDNETLLEAFKNYMSDEYFSFKLFKVNQKIIRINCDYASNISIRRLEKTNPNIFNELLSRYEKIVFYDDFGQSISINKK